MGFGIILGLVLLALGAAVYQALKPELKPILYKPTCPAPIYITKEEEFIMRIKQIKRLVDIGRYDKALALLSRLEVVDINTNTTPVNSGELKE